MGSTLKELLAAKKPEMDKLVAQGAGVKVKSVNQENNVVTGMQSSAERVSQMPQQLPSVKGEIDPVAAKNCLGVFEDNDFKPLKKIIRSKGGKTFAKEGFFYAKDEDDLHILEDYARRGYCKLVILDDLFNAPESKTE